MHDWPMLEMLGSPPPLFPSTGKLHCRGEAYSWRELNVSDWNAYLTFSGSWAIVANGRRTVCEAGTLVLLPPRMPRTYEIPNSTEETSFYWMHFRPSKNLRGELPWLAAGRGATVLRSQDRPLIGHLASLLEEMNQMNLRQPDRPHRQRIVSLLAETVVLRMAAAAPGLSEDGHASVDARIQRAVERIHGRLSEIHSIDTLARQAGLSRSQFCALFRKGLGRSAMAYVEERRLELGRHQLATTDRTVSEIAERTGFESPFYFSRRFRARFGQSPRAHRAAAAGGALRTNGHGSPG